MAPGRHIIWPTPNTMTRRRHMIRRAPNHMAPGRHRQSSPACTAVIMAMELPRDGSKCQGFSLHERNHRDDEQESLKWVCCVCAYFEMSFGSVGVGIHTYVSCLFAVCRSFRVRGFLYTYLMPAARNIITKRHITTNKQEFGSR